MRIAALQDDPAQAVVLEQTLSLAGHRCVRFRDSRALMLALRRETFDMLLLDWEAPGIATAEVLAWVRRTIGLRLPVMLLGIWGDDDALCRSLAGAADALIAKPVRRAEFAARVQALARRMLAAERHRIDLSVGAYRFSTSERRAYLADAAIALSPKEFDLAVLLFRHAGQLVLRDTMAQAVWRRHIPPGSRTIDSHLSRVRTKLALWPHNGVRLTSIYAAGSRLDVVASL